MAAHSDEQLDELARQVAASAKYAAIDAGLVRQIGRRELVARRNLKEAVKATKNRLHQVAGAYQDARPQYAAWAEQLRGARGDEQKLRIACVEIMERHASTRERLPILERFYAETLSDLPPIRSVLDVACGLGPLARPWMPLADGAAYYACDIYADMIAFLNEFFAIASIPGTAQVCDLAAGAPAQRVDVALVLKALPPLEHLEKGAGLRLLRALQADYVIVSFPARSLGGRNKGMVEHYAHDFLALADGEGWPVERFEFASELAFRVRKTTEPLNR